MFGLFDTWSEKYIKNIESRIHNAERIALIIDKASSNIIRENFDLHDIEDSIISNFLFHSFKTSIDKNKIEFIAAIVIGCTQGAIQKYMKPSNNDDADLVCDFIVYRFAKINKVETEREAESIVEIHTHGLSEHLRPIRESASKYVINDFDSRYLTTSHEDGQPERVNSNIDNQSLATCIEAISSHMNNILVTVDRYTEGLDEETVHRALAFEIGVVEYFSQAILNIEENNEDVCFSNFCYLLDYYFKRRYKNNPDSVSKFWKRVINNDLYDSERALGFDSVNNAAYNPGHFPGRYYLKACKLI